MADILKGGGQQMLVIGRSLMFNPKLLMPDETSLGLSLLVAERIFDIIQESHRRSTTVLLVEHNVSMNLTTTRRSSILENRPILLEGPSQSLLEDAKVKKAYLGL